MTQGMALDNGHLMFNGKSVPENCYDPKNFTHQAYENFLIQAKKAGFSFVHMMQKHQHHRTVVLQHNVNFSVNAAAAISEINQRQGVKGTFFVNPDSPFYALDHSGINKIYARGQRVGMLISPRDDNGAMLSDPEINKKAQHAVKRLNQAGIHPVAMAFDIAGADAKRLAQDPTIQISGIPNIYGHTFADGIDRSKQYLANSNGMYLYGTRPEDAIAEQGPRHLHVLIHPDWLSKTPQLPYDRLIEHIGLGNRRQLRDRYLQLVWESNRSVVGDGKKPELDAHVSQLGSGTSPARPPVVAAESKPSRDPV